MPHRWLGLLAFVGCASLTSPALASDHTPPVPTSQETTIDPADTDEGEAIGEARQPWSPLGLFCTVFVIAGGIILHDSGCGDPRNQYPGGEAGCNRIVEATWDIPLGLACVFL